VPIESPQLAANIESPRLAANMPTLHDSLKSLSVVIPACNAARCIESTLCAAAAWLNASGLSHEIILVDDGSTDDTALIVERRHPAVHLLRNGENRGKGHAVRRGMLAARHEWALFMDADHSTHISHLEQFAACAAKADVLIASRNLPESRIIRPQPALRQFLGRRLPALVRLTALPGIRDSQCGFKLFRRECARDLFSRQRVDGFMFDVEVLLLARRLGHRILELPVSWDNPPESTLRLASDPWRMLADLASVVWRLRLCGDDAPRDHDKEERSAPP
jgi:dolichyl-phosphate beta-glucosyltransferase